MPTLFRSTPYIHLQRNPEGRLLRVLEAREGDPMPEQGESDCGLFAFSTGALFGELERSIANGAARGRITGESNFLPIFPAFDGEAGRVTSLRIASDEEALGVNCEADARAIEAVFKTRTSR